MINSAWEQKEGRGISLEDSPELSPAAGLRCALVKAASVVWSIGTRRAALLQPLCPVKHSLPTSGGHQLTSHDSNLAKTFAIRETLNNVSPDFHNLQWGLDQVGQEGCVLVTQSCLTLCHPMYCSTLGSSVHGILQGRILEWVAIPFSRGSSPSRDWT